MIILINFKILERKLLIFLETTKIMFDSSYQGKRAETTGTGFKILTPKQMLQRLPIALAQVKAGNNSERFF